MTEGAWLEVCDGKGLLVEAQMRGLNYSNRAFATAASDPIEVSMPVDFLAFCFEAKAQTQICHCQPFCDQAMQICCFKRQDHPSGSLSPIASSASMTAFHAMLCCVSHCRE